jgi:hypothetical protein
MFSAAMKNLGAAKNVVSVTQTMAGVTENPYCAAERFVFAAKKFVGIADWFVSSAPKFEAGVDTNRDVIHKKAGFATQHVSREETFVRLAASFVVAVEWIVAGIGTFVAFGEGFVSAANKFLFVTNKNFKIGTTDNVLI